MTIEKANDTFENITIGQAGHCLVCGNPKMSGATCGFCEETRQNQRRAYEERQQRKEQKRIAARQKAKAQKQAGKSKAKSGSASKSSSSTASGFLALAAFVLAGLAILGKTDEPVLAFFGAAIASAVIYHLWDKILLVGIVIGVIYLIANAA